MCHRYITQEVFEKTESKLLKNEIDRDRLSIVEKCGVFWIERAWCSDRAYKIAVREVKRIFPNLVYIV